MKKDIQMQRHSVVPKESSKDKLVIGYKKPTGRQSEKKLTAVNHVRGTMSKSPTRTFASNMKNNIKLQQHPVVPKDKLAIWSKRPTSKQPQKKTTSLNPVKGMEKFSPKALQRPHTSIEEELSVILSYINKWLQSQLLWDLKADHLYGKLG
ncbi:hypothetical protein H4Q26_014131 [Puccinia striiformis f. sp. tritici PST-130]|nr:hypothetical protein H4Q26_014131 [Puccinia striiformis f. sp. tritici PST-130]